MTTNFQRLQLPFPTGPVEARSSRVTASAINRDGNA
jgi:hypothetical protein